MPQNQIVIREKSRCLSPIPNPKTRMILLFPLFHDMLKRIGPFLLLLASAHAADVRIYRDTWGVPHIHADTPAGAMYGFGYAQAEDRLHAILQNYLVATGRMAEAFGPEHLDADFRQRLWRHETVSRARYADIPPDVRTLIEAFVEGIRAYMKAHPHRVPEWAIDPQPHHAVALSRTLAFRVLEAQADREYTGDITPRHTGNQWAVSPRRSAEDAAILCIDPFAPWGNTFAWYEAHLHGGPLNAFGFAVPGLPVFLAGHNRTLGWATLPGGADGADVYEIALDSPIANRYRYGDQWRPIVTDTLRLSVRIDTRIQHRTRPYQRTHHGPILHRKDNRAYAYRFALADEVGQIEQHYRMMTAPDQKAFFAALSLAQTAPQRIAYADAYGNIAYFLSGRVPLRSEFHAWHRPVSGNTPETDWRDIHPQEALPMILNPEAGWLQDCDASPDRMANGHTLSAIHLPAYMLNHLPIEESPRSFRARALLETSPRLTSSEAIAFSQDTYVIHSERWLRTLNIALSGIRDTTLASALHILNTWNGRADPEATGMALYARWRERGIQQGRAIHNPHILSLQPLGNATSRALVEAFAEAVAEQQAAYGRLDVYWKEIQRHRRDNRSWPLAGDINSLRAVQTASNHHTRDGISGPSCTTLISFRAPGHIAALSVVPFGQSDDPSSPHYADQAEQFFSQERLKPTQFGISPAKLVLAHTLAFP